MTITLDNPLRLEIHKRMTAMLEEITVANGFRHDLTGRVFRGRGVFGDETPIPAISILEVPIPIDQVPPPKDSTYSSGAWELMIQGWAKDDRLNPTDPAHFLLADVKRRLATERKKSSAFREADGILGLGDSVPAMYIGTGVVRPPDDLSAKAYFWLTITLDLVENLEEPYST